MEPPRCAMPWISAFATLKSSIMAASQKMSLSTTTPCPPTPLKTISSLGFTVYFSYCVKGADFVAYSTAVAECGIDFDFVAVLTYGRAAKGFGADSAAFAVVFDFSGCSVWG